MRILHVEMTSAGGLYQFGVELCNALAAEGHEVHLMTGTHPEVQPSAAVQTHDVLPTWHPASGTRVSDARRRLQRTVRGARYAKAWSHVAAQARAIDPDVIVVGNLALLLDGVAVLALGRSRSIVVQLAHTPAPLSWRRGTGYNDLHKKGRVFDRVIASAYRRIDVPVVLGQQSAQELRARWPTARPACVVPHGAVSHFDDSVAPVETTEPVALFFGSWSRYKGLEILLEAWAEVHRRVPAARLVVAGAVTKDADEAMLGRLAARAGGVELCPGYVESKDVPGLFSAARVVVTPYIVANRSGVIALARARGRAVVTSDAGDLGSTVDDGVDGFVVARGDPIALADALVQLLNDPDLAASFGRAARRRSATEPSWDEAARLITTAARGAGAGMGLTGSDVTRSAR